MEAKDTVIKKKWMTKEVQKAQERLLLEQAEISFKIGYNQALKDMGNK